MVGGVMSRTVILWTPLTLLLHSSVAAHVREIIFVLPHRFDVVSLKVTVTVLQVSSAVATPVLLVLVSAGQSKVMSSGR